MHAGGGREGLRRHARAHPTDREQHIEEARVPAGGAGPQRLRLNDVRRLVDAYRAGWFGHDVDAIMAVVSEDVVFHNVTSGERVEGAPAFREHVASIHERWPDLSFEEHALYLSDDTGVAEWTARATAPDGRRLEWDGLDVINCREGLITRNAVYSSGHAPRVLTQPT